MSNLTKLIAELENAEAGSRELDAKIALIGSPWLAECQPDAERGVGHWLVPEGSRMNFGPSGPMPTYAEDYTTSLDAAPTLVRPGAVWMVQTDYELPGRAHISIIPPGSVSPLNFDADAATPELAMCSVALRARQAEEEKNP